MSVTYKDIDLLSQKSSVAGTEKIPVSDTEYITPNQIVATVPEVVGNPTVPSGTTPTDLETIKIGNNYFSIPSGGGASVSALTSWEIDTIWNNAMD